MRILLVTANFSPHVGGIERFVETLAGGLSLRGHEVTVVCCRWGGAPRQETIDDFEVRRVPSSYLLERRLRVPYPLPGPGLGSTLRKLIAHADVVHVQDALYATSVASLRIAHRERVATVLTQHVAFVPQGRPWLDALEHAAIRLVGRTARLATLVTSYTPATADWVERTWRAVKPRVLPVGVHPMSLVEDRRALRASFGFGEDRFVVLFIGRDVPKKGLGIVLAASDPRFDLVAVTDRTVAAPGVTLLPFMRPDRLQALMGSVDAFVLPSEGEGFPLVLQEAFSAGLPVITTMQPGYDHYVGPDDVLVVDRDATSVKQAILELAGSDKLRRDLSTRSRDLAEKHFGLESFVSAYEQTYHEAREITRAPTEQEIAQGPFPEGDPN